MKEVLDILIPAAFVVFMVFIFGGYHANKRQKEEDNEKKKDKTKI